MKPTKLIKKSRKQSQKEVHAVDATNEIVSANTKQIAHPELAEQPEEEAQYGFSGGRRGKEGEYGADDEKTSKNWWALHYTN